MLHYVHQLVSNCVCLLFGGEQGVYRGVLELLRWKHLPAAAAAAGNDADEVTPCKTKTMSWKTPKHSWGGPQSQVTSICSFVTKTDTFHIICSHLVVNIKILISAALILLVKRYWI